MLNINDKRMKINNLTDAVKALEGLESKNIELIEAYEKKIKLLEEVIVQERSKSWFIKLLGL